MKYRYVGKCLAGSVQFTFPDYVVTMPEGEGVEVQDVLAKKLAGNNHFEAVAETTVHETEPEIAAEVSTEPVKRPRGRPRK